MPAHALVLQAAARSALLSLPPCLCLRLWHPSSQAGYPPASDLLDNDVISSICRGSSGPPSFRSAPVRPAASVPKSSLALIDIHKQNVTGLAHMQDLCVCQITATVLCHLHWSPYPPLTHCPWEHTRALQSVVLYSPASWSWLVG